MKSRYVAWLQKQGTPLFEGGGIYWRIYQGALVPATPRPFFLDVNRSEAELLLRKSGAWFLRYASGPEKQATEWWYTVCDSYDPTALSANTRSKIKRGERNCKVACVDAKWLSDHGYACYAAAFDRYRNARPLSERDYREMIMATSDGPFEYWAVFVDNVPAGYCQCILEEDHAVTNVFKFHPVYLKQYAPYALVSGLIRHFLVEKGMTLSNGSRSVAHDTAFQDFLIKFGFRKLYCHLNIVYQPLLGAALSAFYPARKFIGRLPSRGPIHKLQSLLYQEKLRRACLG